MISNLRLKLLWEDLLPVLVLTMSIGLKSAMHLEMLANGLENLAERHAQWIRYGFQPYFTLVTTYDVPYSSGIKKFADRLKIGYEHTKIKYRIVNGKYEFKTVPSSEWRGLWDIIFIYILYAS
ncbi:MAG: hypothetical protein JST42_10565 [Bacteroidetes bacterium]|nr:hypothetical protein [Bacteroidota bacterium]